MDGRILALPLLLLFSGCGFGSCGTPLFQFAPAAPLTGDEGGLRKFAGEWFDEEGNLVAAISSPPEAQLLVQTPYNLSPKDARLQSGKIVFRLTSDNPEEISLELTGEDEIQVSVARDPNATCGYHALRALVLIRNPSPAWYMKRFARKTQGGAVHLMRDARDAAMDRLARVL